MVRCEGVATKSATVLDVRHRADNNYAGTTFLLGSNGLTVVRRLEVENAYKTLQVQRRN